MPPNTFSPGLYAAQPTESPGERERWFLPGSWRLSGGGPDVAPFDWQFSIPPLVEVTNQNEIQRLRMGADPVLRWDGSLYRSGDIVVFRDSTRTSIIECTADARAGEIRIPVALLDARPYLSQLRPSLIVKRRPSSPLLFPLPLANGTTGAGIVTITASKTYDWSIDPIP